MLPYALFLLLVCVFLWRPIFTGAALLPGDYLARMQPWASVLKSPDPPPQWNPLVWDAVAQFYPWRVFYARSMSAGCIPLWNPHQFCGAPFLANGQSAVLYPPNLLFLLVDPITAFTLLAVLHMFLAASFTYALLRELGAGELGGVTAGVVFAFSAFVVLWLELPTFPAAAAWLPLALLLIHRAVERRSLYHGMLSGLALSMPVLAGHLQIAFYVALAAILWWFWRLAGAVQARRSVRGALPAAVPLAGCLLVLTLITAPQVLSTLELAGNSHRVRDVTAEGYARFVEHAVKPYRLVTAFQPDYYGSPARNDYYLGSAADYMEFGLYAGILPLMLAVVGACRFRSARWCDFFGLLAVLALLVALGTHVNAVLYYLVPGFSALGGPNRILVLYFLAIAVLAGFGADRLAERAGEGGRGRAELVSALIALHAVVFAGVAARVVAGRFLEGLQTGDPIRGYESPVYAALLLASGGLILAAATRRIGRRVFSVLAVLLTAADLFAFGIAFNATCDRAMVYPDTPLTDRLRDAAKHRRIAPINPRWSLYRTPDAILPPNAAMVYGLYDVQGYDSLYTRTYKDLSSDIQGMDSSPPENGNMVLVRRFVGDAPWHELRVGLILAPDDMSLADSSGLREVGQIGGVRIYEFTNGDVGAEAYISPNVVAVDGDGPAYPGWTERAPMRGELPTDVGKADRTRLFVFEPFTFRLGLFLMLAGIAALTCAGTCRRFGSHGGRQ